MDGGEGAHHFSVVGGFVAPALVWEPSWGAILCGRGWTRMNAVGLKGPSFHALWTLLDTRGCGLEIYRSGGWGFESLGACLPPVALDRR